MLSWNQKHIPLPPLYSNVYNIQQIDKCKMLNARSGAHNSIDVYNQSLLWSELWLLQRLCYKLNNQMRREKCIARLKQVSKCLKILQEMNLDKSLFNLVDMIPCRVSLTMDVVYLPSKPIVEYALRCLLGAVAVLRQTINYSTSSYLLITQQLSIGLFPKQMTVMAATVSRVWVLCRSLIENLAECYEAVYIWQQELKTTNSLPTPVGDALPSNLSEWLSSPSDIPLKADDISGFNSHGTIGNTESLGEIIDRDWFNNKTDQSAVAQSPLIKQVKKFLSPGNTTSPQSSPEQQQSIRRRPNTAELHSCMVAVEACSNIAQIYLLIAKLSQSYPHVPFRAMKPCLASLKKLRSAKNAQKDRGSRVCDNKRLLRRGKKAVRKFLAKNQLDDLTETSETTGNFPSHSPEVETTQRTKIKLAKTKKSVKKLNSKKLTKKRKKMKQID